MRPSRVLLAALGVAQVAYGQVPGQRGAVHPGARRAADGDVGGRGGRGARAGGAGWRRSRPRAAIGFGAELLGVHTGRPFGAYSYTGKLGPRVGGVPLLAAAAWALMARPAWVAAGWVARRARGAGGARGGAR